MPTKKPSSIYIAEPRELSIVQAALDMRRGRLTSEHLVRSCLERIKVRQPAVQAWATLYEEQALQTAKDLDKLAIRGRWKGLLHGIPIGMKDIIDVAGMETKAGCEVYPGHLASQDAQVVVNLRSQGAVILGKTVTTAFATGDAGPTTNPWNSAHTPGGSSSGSAAAVADRQCLAAVGTQTGGSIIRPCAYNGLAGFKASHGAVSTAGVIPVSWQLDHVGALTRCIEDAYWMWSVMREHDAPDPSKGPDGLLPPLAEWMGAKLWRPRGVFEKSLHPEVQTLLDTHCDTLNKRGIHIVEREMPPQMEEMFETHQRIMAAELASVHRKGFEENSAEYPPKISAYIRDGLGVLSVDYIAALRIRQEMRQLMLRLMQDVEGIISPAATCPAPEGLDSTGEHIASVPASFMGLPVVCFPAGLANNGLPMALQIMAAAGREDDLFAVTRVAEKILPFHAAPEGAVLDYGNNPP